MSSFALDPIEDTWERYVSICRRGLRISLRRVADRFGLSIQEILTAEARGRPTTIRDARLLFMRSCRRRGMAPRETGELIGISRTGVMSALNAAGWPSLNTIERLDDIDLWQEPVETPAPPQAEDSQPQYEPEPVSVRRYRSLFPREGQLIGCRSGYRHQPAQLSLDFSLPVRPPDAGYWRAVARWIDGMEVKPGWASWVRGGMRDL